MDRHGIALARLHKLSARSSSDRLLHRLDDNEAVLMHACETLTIVTHVSRRISPAGEWLLDNYYLIEEQIRTAQRHLPKSYNRKLPRLAEGASAGLPRVYDLALETISHGDGRVDSESLSRFIASYQTIQPLTLGELWAIPIMLRLALIENLRRVAAKVLVDWNDRDLASQWADTLTEIAERDPKSVVLGVADMARSDPPMASSFVAELARRLQGQGPALAMPLAWLEQRLAETGASVEYLVQLEAQQQAADQVSISNSIGSLRFLSAIDWREFVEGLSAVEHVLRGDPAGIYGGMDFPTRDHYRHVIERLARTSSRSEAAVAGAVVEMAAAHAGTGVPAIEAHVGFYLIDQGLAGLERRLGARRSLASRLQAGQRRMPLALYLAVILLLTVLVGEPLLATAQFHTHPWWAWLLLALATLLVTSQLAMGLVNLIATVTVSPSMLARMDYAMGIPSSMRTLVVVPCLLGSPADVDALMESLEVRYLANRDQHLHFGLLSDFLDADSEVMPADAALLALARAHVDRLNTKYATGELDRFFLLHRPRRWNAADKVWMGYERKRGKLAELNALLRGHGGDRFLLVVGHVEDLYGVRYVITLDTDTQLPRDSARRFVSAMAHPLNRPVFDPARGRVVRGYGILQPRVGVSLPSSARSPYSLLFGSDAGIDPYTRMVSDTYQDLFREGSFIGKGIYDVDAFAQAIEGRFPDNRILSHDLVEGCFARSGLLSDVQLYEEYPASYGNDARRRHRWIRGDWQLLPWMLPRVSHAAGQGQRNPLSLLSRWKIFDNLRRSLVPPAFMALFLVGWLMLEHVFSWTLSIVALVLILPLLSSLLQIVQKPHDVKLSQHLQVALQASGQNFSRALFWLTCLPHEAWDSLDAIGRTLWRMGISHRHLLQWRASSEVERAHPNQLDRLYRRMGIAPAVAVVMLPVLAIYRPQSLFIAAPFLLLWLLAPLAAWWSAQPRRQAEFRASGQQRSFLRKLSRRTWSFFEIHVGPQDNWLPPDNMQEKPVTLVAHRTSPTNIGMALLAHLAACDFGYITSARLIERITRTMETLQRLPRYRGHFFNWYDTLSLQPLAPQYVSSVDSGNLAGHLLTLAQGLQMQLDEPVFTPRLLDGLSDALELLHDARVLEQGPDTLLQTFRQSLDDAQAAPPQNLADAVRCTRGLFSIARHLDAALPVGDERAESRFWYARLLDQLQDITNELQRLTPAGSASPPASQAAPLPTLRQLSRGEAQAATDPAIHQWAQVQMDRVSLLVQQVGEMAVMDFSFLYDAHRDLLSIGYNVDERRLDASFYDLLASEARLASFVTIAQGQLPQEGWFTLGRLLTSAGRQPVLLSWSGSMFEYLMPMLVMPSYQDTLLDQTCRAAVARQIEYGNQLGVPWGISESGYATFDVHFNYQYRAFGVPGLGLKRGLGEDVVIAPYASVMALMVAPAEACANLQRLADEERMGRYGLYEAVDYTPARVPNGQSSVTVSSFMAHHQGMSLLSLAYLLLDRPMQRRFDADPQLRATTLLLQERVPKTAAEYLQTSGFPTLDAVTGPGETTLRVFKDPDMPRPGVQLLSNGRYHVMVSSAGGGYSRCKDIAVTRWHEDITCDNWGQFCYLRDVESGHYWSVAHQPTLRRPELFEAIFSNARAEFRVREHEFDTHTEIVVSPEDDIELRRMRISNRSRTRRTIEITTYAEVVIATASADAAHPAFSNLFVQTELVRPLQAIICSRRPRSNDEKLPWMCHLMAVHDADVDMISYETDRSRFIGRGHSVARPIALSPHAIDADGRLSDTAGSVLDPIVAIRCRVTLDPEQSATIDVVTGIGDSRDACIHLIEKYRDRHLADRVFDLAWTHGQVLLRQLNASQMDARLYERMVASIIYANTSLRADASVLAANRRGQSALWGQAISGDLPIVLLRISDPANIELVRQLVQAHAYWRMKGLAVDLVIWNEDLAGYRQYLQDLILGLIASGTEASLIDRNGGIFVRPAQQLTNEDRILVQSVARVVLSDSRGSLAEQIERRRVETQLPRFDPSQIRRPAPPRLSAEQSSALEKLRLRNPLGGFSEDGTEYVICLEPGDHTPAPWSNVLANASFGTVLSESGGAYTWSENAHEFRLSPWHNDPVTDASGEAIYLRDEETGHFWSPTPLPRHGDGRYITRHGFGYSVFEHEQDGIHTELWVYVALDAPVKFSVLKVSNRSGRQRQLSATGYVEWVLSDLSSKAAMHIVSEADPSTGALFARNAYNTDFAGRVGFFDSDAGIRSITCDRSEFIGRNGSLRAPAAMSYTSLSGRVGAGLDPCAAIQQAFDLLDGESQEIVFRLGAGQDTRQAIDVVQRFRGLSAAANALEAVRMHWHWTLGKVQVETPEPAVDVLANGWLMYQTIACRFWARSGYYQSGGAFGFRDQLQDSMAMIHASPYSARQHLLLCAAHQFPEGDVQHWWHPPLDRGVRTHCSDDYLWLPLATARYVEITADTGVLDEVVGYIDGRLVGADEESYYDLPTRSDRTDTLYRHCVQAIEKSAARGAHGLPLIGTGDWNDGMNRVGEKGRGESVWLGFFLYDVLMNFAKLARRHGDDSFALRCESDAMQLQQALETQGWDGAWYRRAYFDDGTPLGSQENDECRIDSIAQSWSVISGAASEDRRQQAMRSLDQHLVRRDAGLIQLLDPPFDTSPLDPGYIKGYVPGVRENGGQYTHAAVWATMAFAELGDSARAWELLRMISPVTHGGGENGIDVYKVEPYVVVADIYGVDPHQGRGGWSWYTGSAGWMYRLVVEELLGLRVTGEFLHIEPVVPAGWTSYQLHYRHRETDYHLEIFPAAGSTSLGQVSVDGLACVDHRVPLIDDGIDHHVQVRF
jgi:cellobiose phosphorylase